MCLAGSGVRSVWLLSSYVLVVLSCPGVLVTL